MRKTNKRAALVWAVLLLLVLVLFGFRGGILPSVLLALVLLMPVTSLVYFLIVHETVRIDQELVPVKVTKGDAGKYRLVVENAGLLPVQGLCPVMEESPMRMEGEGETVLDLYPGERTEREENIVCTLAGTYPVGVKYIRFRDFLGLFVYQTAVGTRPRALVRPRITQAAVGFLEEAAQDAVRFQMRERDTALLSGDTRPYLPGDGPRSIHWRNFARTGELSTRLYEERESGGILLAALPVEETIDTAGDRRAFAVRRDRFLELVVSAAAFFGLQGQGCFVSFPRGEWQSFVIENEADFRAFYEAVSDGIYLEGSTRGEAKNGLPAGMERQGFGRILLCKEDAVFGEHPFVYQDQTEELS